MSRLAPRTASVPAPRYIPNAADRSPPPAGSPVPRGLPCLVLCAVTLLSGGCRTTTAARPDADVARTVEREDLRVARLTAVAAVDFDAFELMSPGAGLEAIALLSAPANPRADAAVAEEPPGRAEGWDYDAPAEWGVQPWSFSASGAEGWDARGVSRSAGGRGEGALALETDGGGGKPKLRFNFLRLRVNERPVSLSGSLKGLKGVQVKATIKL